MKKTIANTNKYFTNAKSKEKIIVNSVYTSAKVEGSKTTKKELKEHLRLKRLGLNEVVINRPSEIKQIQVNFNLE